MKNTQIKNPAVSQVFEAYPLNIRKKLMHLRALIFRAAAESNNIGVLEETLKWGEPSYLTSQTKSGSTVRIGWKASKPDQYAIYFNCKTTLVDTFRSIYGDTFKYEGNRSIVFGLEDEVPEQELLSCISMSLTYHLDKK